MILEFSVGDAGMHSVEVPKLALITGLNGAGKSRLLNDIAGKRVKICSNEITYESVAMSTVRFETRRTHHSKDKREIEQLYKSVAGHANQVRRNLINGRIIPEHISQKSSFIIRDLEPRYYLAVECICKIADDLQVDSIDRDFTISNLPISVIVRTLGIDRIIDNMILVYNYHKSNFDQLLFKMFKAGQILNYNENDFEEKYGTHPLILVEKCLQLIDSEYSIVYDTNGKHFKHRSGDFKTDIYKLSSGEKHALFVILELYCISNDPIKPDVILLDEPDLGLHPSMAASLIRMIHQIILPHLPGGILLVTHSPTTIAVSSEDRVLLVERESELPRIIDKDRAIQTLTKSVPYLSIKSSSERQVWTEGDADRSVFNIMYTMCRDKIKDDVMPNINFISSSKSWQNGNCTAVLDLTRKLRNAGSETVYGIIDRDESSTGSEFIFILGNGNRYSLENFLLDPTLVAGLMLHSCSTKAYENFMMESLRGLSFTEYASISAERRQAIADEMIDRFFDHLKTMDSQKSLDTPEYKNKIGRSREELITSKYFDGTHINLPKFYDTSRGHDISSMVLDVFPSLRKYKKDGTELVIPIAHQVLSNHPSLMPSDILDTFRAIVTQEVQN